MEVCMVYRYKNEAGRPINLGGYQFAAGQELKSNIIMNRFKEAVSEGILSLREEAGGNSSPIPKVFLGGVRESAEERVQKAEDTEKAGADSPVVQSPVGVPGDSAV
jgi:hypothetical protein